MVVAARLRRSAGARPSIVVAGCRAAGGAVVSATTAQDGGGGAGLVVDANHDGMFRVREVRLLGWWRGARNGLFW